MSAMRATCPAHVILDFIVLIQCLMNNKSYVSRCAGSFPSSHPNPCRSRYFPKHLAYLYFSLIMLLDEGSNEDWGIDKATLVSVWGRGEWHRPLSLSVCPVTASWQHEVRFVSVLDVAGGGGGQLIQLLISTNLGVGAREIIWRFPEERVVCYNHCVYEGKLAYRLFELPAEQTLYMGVVFAFSFEM